MRSRGTHCCGVRDIPERRILGPSRSGMDSPLLTGFLGVLSTWVDR